MITIPSDEAFVAKMQTFCEKMDFRPDPPNLLEGTAAERARKTKEWLLTCTWIQANDKGLTAIPPGIEHFPNVERIQFNNNQLTSLPPEMAGLQRLKSIAVENNKLMRLPESFVSLPKGCHVLAGYNQIPMQTQRDFLEAFKETYEGRPGEGPVVNFLSLVEYARRGSPRSGVVIGFGA